MKKVDERIFGQENSFMKWLDTNLRPVNILPFVSGFFKSQKLITGTIIPGVPIVMVNQLEEGPKTFCREAIWLKVSLFRFKKSLIKIFHRFSCALFIENSNFLFNQINFAKLMSNYVHSFRQKKTVYCTYQWEKEIFSVLYFFSYSIESELMTRFFYTW